MNKARFRPVLIILSALLLTACSAPVAAPVPAQAPVAAPVPAPAAATTGAVASAEAAAVPFVGKLAVEPKEGNAGTEVTATGSGLPANTPLQLNWTTVDGSWILKGDFQEEFHGRDYKERAINLAAVQTDAGGSFQARFKAPAGFGFDHNVSVVDPATGKLLTRTNFFVKMQVSMLNASGPQGTPINFDIKGIGYKAYENSWVVLYDNKVTGWVPSVLSGGNAQFSIPATGAPGRHQIVINHGWASVGYLNPSQTPAAGQRAWYFEFTITPGAPVLPAPAETQGLKPEPGVAPGGTGAAVWTDPATGPINTPVRLLARGLTPGAAVELTWWRMVGNRVAGQWKQNSVSLGKATVAADGTLALEFKAPDDLGGAHRIEAAVGDKVVATGSFTLTPSVLAIAPQQVKAGQQFEVHLKGVGWTETANIYTLVYDNAYVGFGCGFSSQGDVTINLPAAGEPGLHYVDLYPAIYKGEDAAGVYNFRTPMLTGDKEHPHERLPIFHLAFAVTD